MKTFFALVMVTSAFSIPALAGLNRTIDCTVTSSKLIAPATSPGSLCSAYPKFVLTQLEPTKVGDYTKSKIDAFRPDGSAAYCEGGLFMANNSGLSFATKNSDVRIFIPNDGSPATGYVEGNSFFIEYCQLVLNCK